MTAAFVAYKMNIKKQNKLKYGIVLLSFVECLFLIVAIICTILLLPLGIAMLVGCFFFLKLIIKQGKKCREVGKRIKDYTAIHKQTLNIEGDTTYCFVAPFSTKDTMAKIADVLSKTGEVKDVDSLRCMVSGKLQVDLKKMQKITFYIEKNENECKVRAVFKKMANDGWWDFFLQELFDSTPGVDYGVFVANGIPQVAAVMNMEDQTRQVSFSKTTGGRSLGGFLVGGALFGTAGAVVTDYPERNARLHAPTQLFIIMVGYGRELFVRALISTTKLW